MLVTGRMKLKSKSITTIIILLLLVGIAYYFYNNSYENFQSEVSYTSYSSPRSPITPTATIKGEKGDKGDQGPPGPRGEKGDQGETVVLANDIFTGIYDELNKIKSKINLTNGEIFRTMPVMTDNNTPVITDNNTPVISRYPPNLTVQSINKEYEEYLKSNPTLVPILREFIQNNQSMVNFLGTMPEIERAQGSYDFLKFLRRNRETISSNDIYLFYSKWLKSKNITLPDNSNPPVEDNSGPPVNEIKSLMNELNSIINEKPYLKLKIDQAFSQTQYLQQYFNSLEPEKMALFYRNFINFIKTADESTDVMDFERTMRDFFISEGITIISSPNSKSPEKTKSSDAPQVNPNKITEEFNYLINDLQVLTSEKPYLNELFDNNREKLDYLQKYSESLSGEKLNSYLRSAVAFTKAANTSTTVYDIEKFLRNFFISEGIEIPPSPNGEIESFTNRTTSYKDFTSKFNLIPLEYAPVL